MNTSQEKGDRHQAEASIHHSGILVEHSMQTRQKFKEQRHTSRLVHHLSTLPCSVYHPDTLNCHCTSKRRGLHTLAQSARLHIFLNAFSWRRNIRLPLMSSTWSSLMRTSWHAMFRVFNASSLLCFESCMVPIVIYVTSLVCCKSSVSQVFCVASLLCCKSSMLQVFYVASILCCKYSLFLVLYISSLPCYKSSVLQVVYVTSILYWKSCVLKVLYVLNLLCYKYSMLQVVCVSILLLSRVFFVASILRIHSIQYLTPRLHTPAWIGRPLPIFRSSAVSSGTIFKPFDVASLHGMHLIEYLSDSPSPPVTIPFKSPLKTAQLLSVMIPYDEWSSWGEIEILIRVAPVKQTNVWSSWFP